MPVIALLSDFGNQDPFVGIMKGAIAQISPEAHLVDITHQIPPGDIQRGAITLWQSAPHFPDGTVFLSVVDPGVGTTRKAILLSVERRWYVGPDNGLFSYMLEQVDDWQAWELTNPAYQYHPRGQQSATFHGRDIFAPAAAHKTAGVPGSAFGPKLPDLIRLPSPTLEMADERALRGEILTSDHFGNLLTSLGKFLPGNQGTVLSPPWDSALQHELSVPDPAQARLILADQRELPIRSTFRDIPEGACAGVVGSTGLMEIAANQDSAAQLLGLQPGTSVTLKYNRKG